MDQPKAQTPEQRKAALLLASCVIFLVALNLRPAIVAVGPLLSSIGTTFGWGESLQGLLGSLPLLAFALFSMIVGALTAKLDSNKVLLLGTYRPCRWMYSALALKRKHGMARHPGDWRIHCRRQRAGTRHR